MRLQYLLPLAFTPLVAAALKDIKSICEKKTDICCKPDEENYLWCRASKGLFPGGEPCDIAGGQRCCDAANHDSCTKVKVCDGASGEVCCEGNGDDINLCDSGVTQCTEPKMCCRIDPASGSALKIVCE